MCWALLRSQDRLDWWAVRKRISHRAKSVCHGNALLHAGRPTERDPQNSQSARRDHKVSLAFHLPHHFGLLGMSEFSDTFQPTGHQYSAMLSESEGRDLYQYTVVDVNEVSGFHTNETYLVTI